MNRIELLAIISIWGFNTCLSMNSDHFQKDLSTEDSNYEYQREKLEEHLKLIKHPDINRINISYVRFISGKYEFFKETKLPATHIKDVLTSLRIQLSIPEKIISPPKISIAPNAIFEEFGLVLYVDDIEITHYIVHPQNNGWSLELPSSSVNQLLKLIITILKENGIVALKK